MCKLLQACSRFSEHHPALMASCVQVFQVTLESGLGHQTVPLLLAESSFNGLAKNWSSLLQLRGDLTLEVRVWVWVWVQQRHVKTCETVSVGELFQREPRRVGASDRTSGRQQTQVEPGAGGEDHHTEELLLEVELVCCLLQSPPGPDQCDEELERWGPASPDELLSSR